MVVTMENILKLTKINKSFPGVKALTDVDLEIRKGEVHALVGENGAGKSTLMNAVAGVYPVDQGSITIDGADVTHLPEHKRAPYIGRVFQDPMLGTAPTMQILENLALAARRGQRRGLRWGVTKAEKEQYQEMLRNLDLGLEDRLTSKVGLLSGGQRQALTLLMASLKKPKLLLHPLGRRAVGQADKDGELAGKAAERRQAGNGKCSKREKTAGQRHALLQAAQKFHAQGARGMQDFPSAQEEQSLETGMVEHVQKRARKAQESGPGIAAACAEQPAAQGREHQAHVLDAGIGQHALEIALGQGLENAHKGSAKPDEQQQPAPPGGSGAYYARD